MFAEDEAALVVAQAGSAAELDALVARRAAGEPLEHVLGWASFRGLRIVVAPGVFVPRVRSELLAHQAVRCAERAGRRRPDGPRPVVVDLCCGTGAIGLAVAAGMPGVELHASDVDPAAVACATVNLALLAGSPPPAVYEGDLDGALPGHLSGRVDVLVANVPYVPTAAIATLPAEARLHERTVALDGGPDGLDVVRRVAVLAPGWLAPGGAALVETTAAQAPAAAEAFANNGLAPSVVSSDEVEATVVVATAHRAG